MKTERPLDEGLREYLGIRRRCASRWAFCPWFLAGVAGRGTARLAASVEEASRSQPLPFGSLMFFERRTQSSIKHRRLRYLLLFALRALLILLLVLAFAHPYIEQKSCLPRSGEVTVLAIDNSLSMRAGGRLDQAKRDGQVRHSAACVRRARRSAGVRLACPGDERSHRRSPAAQCRRGLGGSFRRPHVFRRTGAVAPLHLAIAPPAARRASLFRHAADRHAE